MMRSTTRRRPILHIPRSPLERRIEILTILGIAAIIALTIWAWFALPAIIPTHYDIAGRPTAYGSKSVLLLILLPVTIFYSILTFVSRYPHTFNYPWPITPENAPRQYQLARTFIGVLKLGIIWLFCILQVMIVQDAQTRSLSNLGILVVAICLPIVIIVTVVGYAIRASRIR